MLRSAKFVEYELNLWEYESSKTTEDLKMLAEANHYQYAELKISISNLGVVTRLSNSTLQRIENLPDEQLRAANKAAWTAKRKAAREMDKYCNVSVYGHLPHDYASQSYQVSELVCKATWRALKLKGAA